MRAYSIYNTDTYDSINVYPLDADMDGVTIFCCQFDLDSMTSKIQTTPRQIGATYNSYNIDTRKLKMVLGFKGPEDKLNGSLLHFRSIVVPGREVSIDVMDESGEKYYNFTIKGYTESYPDTTLSFNGFRQVEFTIELTDPYFLGDAYSEVLEEYPDYYEIPVFTEKPGSNTGIQVSFSPSATEIKGGILKAVHYDKDWNEVVEKLEFELDHAYSAPEEVSYYRDYSMLELKIRDAGYYNLMQYLIVDDETSLFSLGDKIKELTIEMHDSNGNPVDLDSITLYSDGYVSDLPVMW